MKWLDNTLISGPFLTLVLSQKECDKAFTHCGIPKEDWCPWVKTAHSDATLHILNNTNGRLCCIVAMRVKEGVTGVQIAGLLVHEAVHVWQAFRDRIGETSPSSEFEAYSIQTISQTLMEEYSRRIAL
ncbi:MAG: hypothetical protein V4772_08675 [Pseudomonadota bacterium]